jgi:hypothetical protein
MGRGEPTGVSGTLRKMRLRLMYAWPTLLFRPEADPATPFQRRQLSGASRHLVRESTGAEPSNAFMARSSEGLGIFGNS